MDIMIVIQLTIVSVSTPQKKLFQERVVLLPPELQDKYYPTAKNNVWEYIDELPGIGLSIALLYCHLSKNLK